MGNTSTKINDPPRHVILQAWLLYTLAYILTGDLRDPRYAFGGLAPKPNRLIIAIRLAVTENAALAIAYGRELRLHIQRLSWSRDCDVGFYQLLGDGILRLRGKLRPKWRNPN